MVLTIRGSRQKEKVMHLTGNQKSKEFKDSKSKMDFPKVTNPLENKKSSNIMNLYSMIESMIKEEFPQLKNTNLLTDLTLYSVLDKIQTVQTMENVLSCISNCGTKRVEELLFKNGELGIRCSTQDILN